MYKIPANTVFLGKNIVFMTECHSTNTFALQLCQESPSAAEGTVVITADQTAGRGQRGNSWQVEPGKNLTFSVILNAGFLSIHNQFYLNIFASLAVHDYLCHKGCEQVCIKWPNDVYSKGKKICGILVENQLTGNLLSKSVIGIGLNINQRRFETGIATSLSLVLDREFELQDELEIILSAIEARYLRLRQHNLAGLKADYLKAMYWLNEIHTFSSDGNYFDGRICGVDESGRLAVIVENEEKFFGVREISYVR